MNMSNHLYKTFLRSLLITPLALFSGLWSDTTADVFAAHPNKVFIETGTYKGDGVEKALKAGFKTVYSIEISPQIFGETQKRFLNNPDVHLFLGNSPEVLKNILPEITEPATFWLDGHYSGGDTAKGSSWTPLIEELEIIGAHPIKTHTILIDDMRCCDTVWFDHLSRQDIVEAVKKINPGYVITFADGVVPNDVLVAEPPR